MRSIRSWPTWLRRLALSVFLLGALTSSRWAEAGEARPDKLALVGLLKDGQFATLEETLVGYQKRFEADHKAQWPAIHAFNAFDTSDPAIEPRLNEWIAKMPNSYAAPLARGVFYNHLGWLSRGCDCAPETPGSRFDEMRRFFALAKPDSERALALDPRLIVAYQTLADMAMAEGDRSEVERVLNAGLALAPDAIALHESFLFALQPKWLGAPDDVRRYLAALKDHSPSVAGLGWIQGYNDFDQGQRLVDERKYEEALARFDRALGFDPRSPGFLAARADALSGLGRYDEAIAALEPALAALPQVPDYHFSMGKLRLYQQRDPEARASFDKAIAFDPLNPKYLYWRALLLQSVGKYDDAVRDLDAAVTYGKDDVTIQAERSRALTRFASRLDDAVAAAQHVIELAPAGSIGWLRYAEALGYKRDCKAKQALEVFNNLCKRDGGCEVAERDTAPTLIRFIRCDKT